MTIEAKIKEINKKVTIINPFPGLRPFSTEESHLFFGREGQSEIVREYLAKNRFAVVTGASGSGKSSLIYCGLIPVLYGGFISEAGSKWKIMATRPGNSPVENLAAVLAKNENMEKYSEDGHIKKHIFNTMLRRSSFGLVDAVKQMKIPAKENILLIIDQFEELFRYKESRKDSTTVNETEAYIKLLVNAVKQRDLPIYIVLTMRSDFIGHCSQFQELTTLINESNFLIPQMSREDFREAVLGPIAVGGAEIDPQLLQHILNTIEDKTDQLPVLQHVMMRTWDYWLQYNESGNSIKMRDYEAAGKIENALSRHANEAYDELTDKGKEICKVMFRSLTEQGANNQGIRHPASIKYIAEIAQVSDKEAIEVAEKFRAKGRSFITPGENVPLDSDTVIDISHESLMRIWDKLKAWVEEETSSVQMYLRLAEASSQYQLGKTGLWRPPDLHLALNWKKTQKPTLTWAKRYNPAFEKVMVFLDASEKKFIQEEQNKVRLQRRAINRTRRFASISGIIAVIVLGLLFVVYNSLQENKRLNVDMVNKNLDLERITEENVKLRELAELRADKEAFERVMAQIAADSARIEKLKAETEARQAFETVTEVTQYSQKLEKTTEIAEKERQLALKTAEIEREERTEAEKEKEIEYRRRMLQIAQTMASKSLTANDNNLKALLAYQAYKFNKQFNGPANNPDIYTAFYSVLVAFNGSGYNSMKGHMGAVRSIVFLPNSDIFYSSGGDGRILRWDLNSSTKTSRTLIDNNFINRSLAISNNKRWLACGTPASGIQLFNLNNPNTPPQMLEGHKDWVDALAFTPDNKGLFSASTDNSIMYWDLIAGTKSVFFRYENKITSISASPNGKYLTGGTSDGKIILWDLGSNKSTVLYESENNFIMVLKFNSSGNKIAFGNKTGTLGILNLRTNRVLRIKGHVSRITDLQYSPDDNLLATASYDGTIKIWDANNLNIRPITIKGHEAWVLTLAFNRDGKYLVTGDNAEKIFIWDSKIDYMAEDICSKINRNMTTREWETYVGYDIDYQKTCTGK
jgi:energy-coupling factor transporter ATP-binding protein EcfA2